jgi:hypothetical protein
MNELQCPTSIIGLPLFYPQMVVVTLPKGRLPASWLHQLDSHCKELGIGRELAWWLAMRDHDGWRRENNSAISRPTRATKFTVVLFTHCPKSPFCVQNQLVQNHRFTLHKKRRKLCKNVFVQKRTCPKSPVTPIRCDLHLSINFAALYSVGARNGLDVLEMYLLHCWLHQTLGKTLQLYHRQLTHYSLMHADSFPSHYLDQPFAGSLFNILCDGRAFNAVH